jgi:hypothetical protein
MKDYFLLCLIFSSFAINFIIVCWSSNTVFFELRILSHGSGHLLNLPACCFRGINAKDRVSSKLVCWEIPSDTLLNDSVDY